MYILRTNETVLYTMTKSSLESETSKVLMGNFPTLYVTMFYDASNICHNWFWISSGLVLESRSSHYSGAFSSSISWKTSPMVVRLRGLKYKEASTVFCSVAKHAGSGRARNKCRGKHETQSSALQQNTAQSRLLYLFYDKVFNSFLHTFANQTLFSKTASAVF